MGSYTHNQGFSTIANGYAVGAKGSEVAVISQAGVLAQAGEPLNFYTKKITVAAGFDSAEQDSGWTIPTGAVIHDVILQVDTADASQTLAVGTDGSGSNDPDGFLDDVSVAATGLVRGVPTFTTGSSEVFFASSTVGDLLAPVQTAGSDAATDVGTYIELPDLTSGGDNLTYTGSDTTNTMAGSIHVIYTVVT